jgi:hypothetical protein
MILWTQEDDEALDAFTQAGRCFVPAPVSMSELSPERAVFEALGAHLRRIQAAVEGSSDQVAPAFKIVWTNPPSNSDVAQYPSASIRRVSVEEKDAITGTPYLDENGNDIVSADGQYGLWQTGEDVGVLLVEVASAYSLVTDALSRAVEDALSAGDGAKEGAVLPLPLSFIPEIFRDQITIPIRPVCLLHLDTSGAAQDVTQGDGRFTNEVRAFWQAPRLACKPFLPPAKIRSVQFSSSEAA